MLSRPSRLTLLEEARFRIRADCQRSAQYRLRACLRLMVALVLSTLRTALARFLARSTGEMVVAQNGATRSNFGVAPLSPSNTSKRDYHPNRFCDAWLPAKFGPANEPSLKLPIPSPSQDPRDKVIYV
jgi:hypothetical protein